MPSLTVKFLAGIREQIGKHRLQIRLNNDAELKDLERHLRKIGIDPDSKDTIIILNGRGIGQWPADRRFQEGDEVVVFPSISGG